MTVSPVPAGVAGPVEIDRLRDLIEAVAHGAVSTLPAALTGLCEGVAQLGLADTVEIWHHDRRARRLALAATSDARRRGRDLSWSTADARSQIAAVLRRHLPEPVAGDPIPIGGLPPGVLVPLRGRRRALGVLALHGGPFGTPANAAALVRAAEMGRHLSGALDHALLLDDVLRSRAQLQRVFDSLVDLVIVTGGDGRIVEVNRACAARLGQPRDALVDQPLDAWLSPALLDVIARARAGASAGPFRAELDDESLGGRFEVRCTALGGPEGVSGGQVVVARDITVEARRDAERAALEQRLAQSEKLLALGQFVAGIAHELNNPLQGVLGHLDLVRARREVPAAARRDLLLASREAERAARIVGDLLVFAGSGRLRRRRLAVNALVGRVLRLRAGAHKNRGIVVQRVLADGLPGVRGDGLLLQQAVLNLIVNAEQAMGGAGHMVVGTAPSAQGHVVITIDDDGPGLSPDVQAHMFEPFFTTKAAGVGTGLGLAITYGIVQAHGGTIEACNREGGGARFAITLNAEGSGPEAHPGGPTRGRHLSHD